MKFDITIQRTERREHTFRVYAPSREAAVRTAEYAAESYNFYDGPVESATEEAIAIRELAEDKQGPVILERSKRVIYGWWKEDGSPIRADHIELLDEEAENHIRDRTEQGFTSGHLLTDLYVDDSEDVVQYRGWWTVLTL